MNQEPPAPPEFEVPKFEPNKDPFAAEPNQYTADLNTDTAGRWSTETTPAKTSWERRILIALVIACISSTIWLGIFALKQYQATAERQIDLATLKASTLVHTLEQDFLKPAELLVTQMHAAIQHNEQDLPALKALVNSNKFTLKPLAFGVAYKQFAYDDQIQLYAPFYRRNTAGEYELIDTIMYDYTRAPTGSENFDSRWFTEGIKGEGAWQEPYFGQVLQDWIAEYSLPLKRVNPTTGETEVIGIVYADFSLEEVREMVRTITLDNLAYGYLVSPQGVLVSHPAPDLIGKPLLQAYNPLIQEFKADAATQLQGQHIVDRVKSGQNFIEEFYDEATGQTSLVVHQQVPKSHWSFGIVMPKDSIYTIASSNKKTILWAAISLAIAVTLSLLVLRQNELEDNQLPWLISILTSVLALFVTVLTLFLFWDAPQNTPTKLFSIAETLSARGQSVDSHAIIPTGLLLNSIEFPQPETAAVGGILWQKFPLDEKNNLQNASATPKGIVWPDAKLGTEQISPLRSYEENGMLVKIWRFSIELALNRNITRFPFDMSEIKLRMRTLADTGAVLVPDFQAYDILIPEVKPGVEETIDLTYWTIRSSFFSVDDNVERQYSGTQIIDQDKASEIIFRVQMARQSHVTLISYFLPIFIGSIMMFVVLMIPSDRSPGAVFSTLSYGGTIFFIISIFHVNLRNSEGIDSFTYLESYYIMQHILVMLISLNGFFLMRGNTPWWAQYRNNLIPKTLYWPSLSIFLASSTLAYFL